MQHETQPKYLCFIFFSHLFVFLTLLMWNSTKRKAAVSLRIFWRPWQNGWVSITVMRLQEWPPRFLHLRHLSLRLLQGIQSFLYNSLLSLLLLSLSFALWSHSLFIISEICKRCVHLDVCMRGWNISHVKPKVNEECWHLFSSWTISIQAQTVLVVKVRHLIHVISLALRE